RALSAEIADAPNIVVLDDILSADDMNSLVAKADTILSLHRSEGFGLLLAEAMLLSKPVVATGWSGNVDLMDETSAVLVAYSLVGIKGRERIYSAFGGHWAGPDVESAARSLRPLADDGRF